MPVTQRGISVKIVSLYLNHLHCSKTVCNLVRVEKTDVNLSYILSLLLK